jgi:hypothetical protein
MKHKNNNKTLSTSLGLPTWHWKRSSAVPASLLQLGTSRHLVFINTFLLLSLSKPPFFPLPLPLFIFLSSLFLSFSLSLFLPFSLSPFLSFSLSLFLPFSLFSFTYSPLGTWRMVLSAVLIVHCCMGEPSHVLAITGLRLVTFCGGGV